MSTSGVTRPSAPNIVHTPSQLAPPRCSACPSQSSWWSTSLQRRGRRACSPPNVQPRRGQLACHPASPPHRPHLPLLRRSLCAGGRRPLLPPSPCHTTVVGSPLSRRRTSATSRTIWCGVCGTRETSFLSLRRS